VALRCLALALVVVVASAYSASDYTGTCVTGKKQSPINIEREKTQCVRAGTADGVKHKTDFFYWKRDGLEASNNGHTIKIRSHVGFVTLGGCSPCDGQRYNLKQIHFHAPSEHQIDGKSYALEAHLVHQKEGATGLNDLLFVAVFFYEQLPGGFPNGFLSQLDFAHLPAAQGGKNKLGIVDVAGALSESLKGEYYTYSGSLTTPTCDETVKWVVMKTPLGAPKEQLDAFRKLYPSNARAVQDTNGRHVTWYRKSH